mmetsp:Transcript_6904/g.14191  ORF Transcript_6904/g.14191 Transcript_6904/m.14191 type:complete len:88 (-) Transcript_6904:221-484(-)
MEVHSLVAVRKSAVASAAADVALFVADDHIASVDTAAAAATAESVAQAAGAADAAADNRERIDHQFDSENHFGVDLAEVDEAAVAGH